MSGTFRETALFGNIELAVSAPSDQYIAKDSFVANLDPEGNFIWAKRLGLGTTIGNIGGMAAFADGSSIITGSFTGTLGDTGVTLASGADGSRLGFVARLDQDGNFDWIRSADEISQLLHYTRGSLFPVATLDDGSCLIGGGAYSEDGSSTGFIAKLDANTNLEWITPLDFGPSSLSLSSEQSILVAGDSLDFYDAAIAKISPEGVVQWTRLAGGDEYDTAIGISSFDDGSSIVTGSFRGTASFGDFSLTSDGPNDGFVARLSTDGVFEWVLPISGPGGDAAYCTTIRPDGSPLIAGTFQASLSFGGDQLSAVGTYDSYIAALLPETTAVAPPTVTSDGTSESSSSVVTSTTTVTAPADSAPAGSLIQANDSDGDGLREVVSTLDGNIVDGNRDGISDALQANVVGIRLINNGALASDYGAIVIEPDCQINEIAFTQPTSDGSLPVTTRGGGSLVAITPDGVINEFNGVVSFNVSGIAAGGTTQVTISFPAG